MAVGLPCPTSWAAGCGKDFSSPGKEAVKLDHETLMGVFGGILETRLGGNGRVEVCEVIRGNINRIYKMRYAGKYFGVRVSTNQYRFKYEKDIIKEVFAICLLNNATEDYCDAVAKDQFERLSKSPTGADLSHDSVRTIVYYDWTRERVPYPFFIYEWVDGSPLWKVGGEDHYFLAGQDLAKLHRVRFAYFYQDLYKIGHVPLGWALNFGLSLSRELSVAEPGLPPSLIRKAKSLDISGIAATGSCLVHNDYSGGNIIVLGDETRRIIDWDNWVVEAPELDLVKMKYWTAIGEDGMLSHDESLFNAFLDGYRSFGGVEVNEDRLRAYEYLWLVRTYNFESMREENDDEDGIGKSWARHYPPPEIYEDYLVDL